MKISRSAFFASLFIVACSVSACKKEDRKGSTQPTAKARQTDFSDESPNSPEKTSPRGQTSPGETPTPSTDVPAGDEQTPNKVIKEITGLRILNVGEVELARYQGVGVETVVIDGAIYTADMPEVKPPFENGAPICVLEFDSAASLVNQFKLVVSETDDTQEIMQTNMAFQDHEQNNLTIRCLHLKAINPEVLQETFRGLVEFQLSSN